MMGWELGMARALSVLNMPESLWGKAKMVE